MNQGSAPGPGLNVAADNDILLKAVCYHTTSRFWPTSCGRVGILGAARFVVSRRLERMALTQDRSVALAEFDSFLNTVIVLEPTPAERQLAAEMEVAAQQQSMDLDAGESQLGAMVVERGIGLLQTGDKRAIRALDQLVERLARVAPLAGRVHCLEQVARRVVDDGSGLAELAVAVCAEPSVDITLSICFGCRSHTAPARDSVIDCLDSYIDALRKQAATVLATSSDENSVGIDEPGDKANLDDR